MSFDIYKNTSLILFYSVISSFFIKKVKYKNTILMRDAEYFRSLIFL